MHDVHKKIRAPGRLHTCWRWNMNEDGFNRLWTSSKRLMLTLSSLTTSWREIKVDVSNTIWWLSSSLVSGSSTKKQSLKARQTKSKIKINAFFYFPDVIYKQRVPSGKIVNRKFLCICNELALKDNLLCKTNLIGIKQMILTLCQCSSALFFIFFRCLAQTLVKIIHHLPYSLDLAPVDYLLFLKLKLALKRMSMPFKTM